MKSLKLFVSCLPGDTKTEELISLFRKHAQVTSITLARKTNKKHQPYCAGYGFVVCPDVQQAKLLLNKSKILVYKKRQLIFREFKSGKGLQQEKQIIVSRRLFIGNIPPTVGSSELEALFSKFGPIEAIYIVNKPQQNGLFYGYTVFESASSASKALTSKFSLQIHGSLIRVEAFNGKKYQEGSNHISQSKDPRQSNSQRLPKPAPASSNQSSQLLWVAQPPIPSYRLNHQKFGPNDSQESPDGTGFSYYLAGGLLGRIKANHASPNIQIRVRGRGQVSAPLPSSTPPHLTFPEYRGSFKRPLISSKVTIESGFPDC